MGLSHKDGVPAILGIVLAAMCTCYCFARCVRGGSRHKITEFKTQAALKIDGYA